MAVVALALVGADGVDTHRVLVAVVPVPSPLCSALVDIFARFSVSMETRVALTCVLGGQVDTRGIAVTVVALRAEVSAVTDRATLSLDLEALAGRTVEGRTGIFRIFLMTNHSAIITGTGNTDPRTQHLPMVIVFPTVETVRQTEGTALPVTVHRVLALGRRALHISTLNRTILL